MSLILSIVSYKHQPAATPRAQRFEEAEITLGRVPQNSFVLPDPDNIVSKTHCIIRRRGNVYELADSSSNGTFINAAPEPLGRERTAALKDGDRLVIGDYDILVRVAPDPAPAMPFEPPPQAAPAPALAPFPDPFGAPNPFDAPPAPAASPLPPAADPFGLQNLVPPSNPSPFGSDFGPPPPAAGLDALFPPNPFPDLVPPTPPQAEAAWPPPNAAAPAPWVTPPDHTPPEQASFRVPDVAPPAIPEDWDPLAPMAPVAKSAAAAPSMPSVAPAIQPQPALPPDDAFGIGRLQVEPAAEPVPQRPAVPPVASALAAVDEGGLVQAFLAAAGLPSGAAAGQDASELMRQVGTLLREMVAGLCEVLAARSMIKGEYRLDRTQIGAANNNPLKLSPTAEGALELLVGPARPGYMPGTRAVKEGFRDVKAHELALIAGMQASVSALLKQFDPEQLKNRLDKHSLLQSLVPGSRKAKYWEIYEQQYRQIAGDVSEDVNGVFGRAFARAYEEQIEKLSS